MEFSLKLKRLMGEHRYSQPALAKVLDVSQTTVSFWTLGKGARPDMTQCLTLARLFGVTMEYLADDSLDSPITDGLTESERRLLWLAELVGMETALRRVAKGDESEAGTSFAVPRVARAMAGQSSSAHHPAQTSYGPSSGGLAEADDDQADDDLEQEPPRDTGPPRVVALQDTTEALRRELRDKERPKKVEPKKQGPKGKPKGEK